MTRVTWPRRARADVSRRATIGIPLSYDDLAVRLDEGIALARSKESLPALWEGRTRRLGDHGIKTYIAALGAALLAKATNSSVDSLTQDEGGGQRGYSLRRVAEFMALNNNGRYHLGAEGRWPVNNRPFLGGPSRITDFTKISARAMPAYGDFRDYLYDLDKLNGEQALAALAAFLRIRMEVAREQKEARQRALGVVGSGRLADVLGELDPFLARSSEGGRLGQALVAAVLDCVFDDVRLRSINDPGAGDVRVMEGDDVLLPAEVKQTPVGSETALALAREAAEMGADKALLAVMHGKHRPLPRDDIRRRALEVPGPAEVWLTHGRLHRADGPAIVCPDPAAHRWWREGLPVAESSRPNAPA